MTPRLDDIKTTVEQIPQANGSVAVKIFARERADVQAEIDRLLKPLEDTNGTSTFFGPFRVNFGYVAIGNYHVFHARHFQRES